jgi:hypothetical protein
MQTAFIRHNFSEETLKILWKNGWIAVQFYPIRSTLPEDYIGKSREGRNALKRLWKYCNEGALIGATYRGLFITDMIIGEIAQGSKMFIYDIEGYPNKIIQLQNTKVIHLDDYPVLLAIQPPHMTTTGWPSANKILNAIYNGEQIIHEVTSLDPAQLEILCSEYLRITNQLMFLLLPVGRTMNDIDIYGINEKNERLFAQVTQTGKFDVIEKKIGILKQFERSSSNLFFFGPDKFNISNEIVTYVSIEFVFSFMQEKYPNFVNSLFGL